MPKIMFTNPHSDKSFAVWVEPWARDYWLLPGDVITLEFREANRVDQMPEKVDFDVAWHDDGVVVWTASLTEVAVQDRSGTELECGHQRPMES
ncbi:hypothetical protein [Nocardia tengchongensis]|uniref:hypothetical protein n=1 Tax=Nocardia tengchongensis TaxID=2055889 RepID=UPI003697F891